MYTPHKINICQKATSRLTREYNFGKKYLQERKHKRIAIHACRLLLLEEVGDVFGGG